MLSDLAACVARPTPARRSRSPPTWSVTLLPALDGLPAGVKATAGDVDGDLDQDLIITPQSFAQDDLVVFANDGAGNLDSGTSLPFDLDFPKELLVLRANLDAADDAQARHAPEQRGVVGNQRAGDRRLEIGRASCRERVYHPV